MAKRTKHPHEIEIPRNIEAEWSILEGILIRPDVIDDLLEKLHPTHFSSEPNRIIYESCLLLRDKGVDINPISLLDSIEKRGLSEKVDQDLVYKLVETASTSVAAPYHAELVREAAMRRELMFASETIYKKALDPTEELSGLLDGVEQQIYEIANNNQTSNGFKPLFEVLQESYRIMEESSSGKISGIESGFKDLDITIAGFQRKDLNIIGGRPSMGKTALALNIAYNVAASDIGVAFFSLEMSQEQLALRLAASVARVDQTRIRSGRLRDRDYKSFVEVADEVSELPIYIDETPSITLFEMKSKLRRLQRNHKIGLVIVDYLQLMGSSKPSDSRQLEVSEYSRGLKAIAKSFDLPVIALSQLNRKVEDRSKKKPELSDLRDSGSIEQDADVVLLLFRPAVYDPTADDKGVAELIVAKQRNGPVGKVKLTYLSNYTQFENYSQRE